MGFVYETLDKFHAKTPISVVIEGGAEGADRCARLWANANVIVTFEYPADWKAYGKKAGYLRNIRMRDEGKPDVVIAFPGGKGTQMMVDLAKEKNIPVLTIEYKV